MTRGQRLAGRELARRWGALTLEAAARDEWLRVLGARRAHLPAPIRAEPGLTRVDRWRADPWRI